jgi:hypothetical protein
MGFNETSLEEWLVHAKRAAPLKVASLRQSISAPFTPPRHESVSSLFV